MKNESEFTSMITKDDYVKVYRAVVSLEMDQDANVHFQVIKQFLFALHLDFAVRSTEKKGENSLWLQGASKEFKDLFIQLDHARQNLEIIRQKDDKKKTVKTNIA